jgi:hypothetical protein
MGALAVPLLSGCTLFGFPGAFPGGFPDENWEFPEPGLTSRYGSGTATLRLDDGTVVELPDVAESSSWEPSSGYAVRWTGPDGWSLSLTGMDSGDPMSDFEYLSLDRIEDGVHWTVFDPTGCDIDLERATADRVAGTAACNGLQWTDALDQTGMMWPDPPDTPEFDVEITFEADGQGTSSSG